MGTKGEEERGQTAGQARAHTQKAQGRDNRQKEGREQGERNTDGLAPGGVDEERGEGHGSRQGAGRKKSM